MNADSVKARLKNFSVSSGCTFQEALVYLKPPSQLLNGIHIMDAGSEEAVAF